jgi:hypothetical protein
VNVLLFYKLTYIKHSFLNGHVSIVIVPISTKQLRPQLLLGHLLLLQQHLLLLLPPPRVVGLADIDQGEGVQLTLILPLVVGGDFILLVEVPATVLPIPCGVQLVGRRVGVYGIEVGLAEAVVIRRPLFVLRLLVHIHNLGRVLYGLGESCEVRELRVVSLGCVLLLQQLMQGVVAKAFLGVPPLQGQVDPGVNLLDNVGTCVGGGRTLGSSMLRLGGRLVHKPSGLVLPLLSFGCILNDQLLCSDMVHRNRREFVLSLRSCSILRSL